MDASEAETSALSDTAVLESTLRQLHSGAIPPRVVNFLARELPILIECSNFLDCFQSDSEALIPVTQPKPKSLAPSKSRDQLTSSGGSRPSPTTRIPPFPPEIIEKIIQMAEDTSSLAFPDFVVFEKHLRVFSLVNKEWCALSRKILWSIPQVFTSAESIKRYRDVLTASPHLTNYVQTVDLSSPEYKWSPDKIKKYFRRAAGLLRQTPNCTTISVLHTSLSENVRRRFFNALGALKIQSASFDSSCWNSRHTLTMTGGYPDVEALMELLCRWTNLRTLSLIGYLHFPRFFSSELLPKNAMPTYYLTSLELVGCEFDTCTLLWLIGSQVPESTLQVLEIHHVTGLMPSDVETVLNLASESLKVFKMQIDVDDWNMAVPVGDRVLGPNTFSQLRKVEELSISTDQELQMPIIASLGQLASLRELTIQCPDLVIDRVSTFLDDVICPLQMFSLSGWGESLTWPSHAKYAIASKCEAKNIQISIDKCGFTEIETAWHGIGDKGIEICADSWDVLEKVKSQRKSRKKKK